MKSVVSFAKEILEMQQEIDFLRHEIEYYKQYEVKYNNLLDSSLMQNKVIIGGMLELGLKLAGETK